MVYRNIIFCQLGSLPFVIVLAVFSGAATWLRHRKCEATHHWCKFCDDGLVWVKTFFFFLNLGSRNCLKSRQTVKPVFFTGYLIGKVLLFFF